jgi:uncharacterized membrane protein YeaQ/YmgE (transglycosylase-associated protein family)
MSHVHEEAVSNFVSGLLSTLDGNGAAIHIGKMAKNSKTRADHNRTKRQAGPPAGFRSPVRLSIDHDALAALDKRAIAAQVGIGVAAGWLASWFVGGSGLLQYIVTGLAGSLIGGFLLERLEIDLGIRNQTASRIVTATIGAVVVVLLARLIH